MTEDTASATPGPRFRGRDLARLAAYGGGAITAVGLAAVGVLVGQAEAAKRIIPLVQAPAPRSDGLYGGRFSGDPLRFVMLGDSSAAGFGAIRARQTAAAMIATGLARRLERPVHLHNLAVVGATSASMQHQVDEALELNPEVVVIFIGANDVTHQAGRGRGGSVRYLADAVRRLREAGARVIVGTCPDLGAVQPIRPPLRWLARRWSRDLAAAQTVAVVEAGGWTVSLGDLLGPAFSAQPHRLFARDRFHPSPDGYALAAAVLLPTVIAAVRAPSNAPAREAAAGRVTDGVRSLPQAAVEAARHAGTEVSGVRVDGRDRGPAGRWAQLRRRMWEAVRPGETPAAVRETAEREPAGQETAAEQAERPSSTVESMERA